MISLINKIISFFMVLFAVINSMLGLNCGDGYLVAPPELPVNYSEEEVIKTDNADYYVAVDGNDENDGSFEKPFATIEHAIEVVAGTDKTGREELIVAVKAGEYRVNTLDLSSAAGTDDCKVKYVAYGDGEAVINGGVTLDPSEFTQITDSAVLSRLSADAQENVLCYDLIASGITKEDYGKIYAIGTYNTAHKYTGDYTGPLYCELFVNDERMTVARYPDNGFLKTGKVISVGEGYESDGSLTVRKNWDNIVDPKGDVYTIDNDLADRINSWQTFDEVWMFGFWKYDWADASSLIGEFDYAGKTISTEFVSFYGAKEGAPYYFFNVFEELDNPGEWYLDRNNGVLYLYPKAGFENASVDLSLSTQNIIQAYNVTNLEISGFTIKGTRGDAITMTGDNITVSNCIIKNIAGSAVYLNGYNNLVTRCEITRTGKAGIVLAGGDRETLTPGNSRADNNLIHDWSEIYQTYQPAISLDGVGNICSHNEIYNSPHEAITYGGNDHLIEYNVIHDVCLLSDDAGAIYAGRSWCSYGTVVRYNCIYNLGSDGHSPNGIYFDDALSGQTAYGNLLVNVPSHSFLIGGGRDISVKNNIIVNSGTSAVTYDQRAIDGVNGGWFTHSSEKNGDMWTALFASPWQTETWKQAYPQMTRFSDDFDNQNDPDFVPNPAYSEVNGNLVVNLNKKLGDIAEKTMEYSDVSGNAVYSMLSLNKIFTDPESGDYTIKDNSVVFDDIPGFEPLPLGEMGRY